MLVTLFLKNIKQNSYLVNWKDKKRKGMRDVVKTLVKTGGSVVEELLGE
jgi:hypothetical protein